MIRDVETPSHSPHTSAHASARARPLYTSPCVSLSIPTEATLFASALGIIGAPRHGLLRWWPARPRRSGQAAEARPPRPKPSMKAGGAPIIWYILRLNPSWLVTYWIRISTSTSFAVDPTGPPPHSAP